MHTVFNPVAPYGYLPCICSWQISQIHTCLRVVIGSRFVSTSPASMGSSASHPVGPHARLAQKTVKRAPIAGGWRVRHNLHSSTACMLCRLDPHPQIALFITFSQSMTSYNLYQWILFTSNFSIHITHYNDNLLVATFSICIFPITIEILYFPSVLSIVCAYT